MNKAENLRRLLAPRSIVMVGGSNLELPIRNTRDIGFAGEVWVVNPKYDEIAGIKCYPSIDALPGVPDAAFVAVNAAAAVPVVRALREQGCGGAVCYAAGFAETGVQGKALQDELVRAAGDMALVGPNCYGVLNFADGAALWPDRLAGGRVDQGVAIISQSGNVSLNLTMHDRSLPITHVISVGNQAVLEVGDYIEPLVEDGRVRAIGFYIEGLRDVEAFSRAALAALRKGIALVVLKAGVSEVGTQLTLSHTSSLAGQDDMYQALFDRLGIIRVHSLSEMVEALKLAALCEQPAGSRVGVLTCSGGDSAMLADCLAQHALDLPALSADHVAALDAWLPPFATRSNPLDYNTSVWGQAQASEAVFATMMRADFDIVLMVLDFPRGPTGDDREWQVAVDALIAARAGQHKTVAVISNFSELLPEDARARLARAGIAPLQGMSDGVSALAGFVRHARRRREVLAMQTPDLLQLRAARVLDGDIRMLNEWDSKQLLGRFGLPNPGSRVAETAQVGEVAAQVGFPVVLKAVGDNLAHKTELGAVALNLGDVASVQGAAADMVGKLQQAGIRADRFLIEPMIQDGVGELIIGIKRDPLCGPALVIGTGGILVNLLNDSATVLLPTTPAMVRQALDSLKGILLFKGFRNRPVGDLDAVVDAVMAVADFALAHWDDVAELDINPLIVRPRGKGVVAVDALLRLQ
ncbi:acetate--CoA ligase family protein [Castellaniella caeni]|uniref:acetate--CoA ligase family protein n=1 Tax=Castellaniella caeni TaxID=266123 RepID=UPI000836B0C0|nr:acetate--CoA ligase family protein [Castellaniella caeni]